MELKFFIDPDTELPHIYNHGVTEAEVREILARPGLVLDGRENSRIALGGRSIFESGPRPAEGRARLFCHHRL